MMKWEARGEGLTAAGIEQAVLEAIKPQLKTAKKVLLIPPDITRVHSRAGLVTCVLYRAFEAAGAHCDLLPALGTHMPMDGQEIGRMFPGIPKERFFAHDWRDGVEDVGEIPADFVREISGGAVDFSMKVQLNRMLLDASYDAIYAIGQVVPHEVAGLSSFSKHIFIGCGGWDMINHSHFLGAAVGAENIMGRRDNPVRNVLDRAEREYAKGLPLSYFMTVIGPEALENQVNGLYFGREEAFCGAAELCVALNINHMERPIQKAVVYLEPEEYRSTWLGNKAVYRTRMALAPGAELIVLAGGVRVFGEDAENDRLIRKFGYCGREGVLEHVRSGSELAENLSVAAHLIHGSHDGKFSVTYAVDPRLISLKEIESVGFQAADYAQMAAKYDPAKLTGGFQQVDGEEIFFIGNPGLGLWACSEK